MKMLSKESFKRLIKKRAEFMTELEFSKLVFVEDVLKKVIDMGKLRFEFIRGPQIICSEGYEIKLVQDGDKKIGVVRFQDLTFKRLSGFYYKVVGDREEYDEKTATFKLTMVNGKTEKVICEQNYNISKHIKQPEKTVAMDLAKGIGIRFNICVQQVLP